MFIRPMSVKTMKTPVFSSFSKISLAFLLHNVYNLFHTRGRIPCVTANCYGDE